MAETDDASTEPANLDLALGWLERNVDDLAGAGRRAATLAAEPTVQLAVPAAIEPPAGAGSSPGQPSPAADPTGLSSPTPSRAPASSGTELITRGAPTTARPTPLLDQVGRDLTKLAAEGSLAPVIGREAETAWLIEVLVRRSKRNPVLLGPAGAGKTAIVEGLAQRIVAGAVPKQLLGVRLIEVPLSSLVAGTQYRGQFEERMAQLVHEASQPGIVLFFDEIHLLVGSGTSEGSSMDAGQLLKPALARGEIAAIGATTPDEYRKTIERDSALARRFTTVNVHELTRDETRPILKAVRDSLAKSRGVHASDAALDVLLDFAEDHIANRRFPDKAIDLLEQAIAHGIVAGRSTVDKADALQATRLWAVRASATPTLDRFGRDLVRLAREGRLGPIVGRDREIESVVEILLRRTKRNPILLGPAGSGKTAIVEGLALRIAAGNVPAPIRDVHLFDLPLVAVSSATKDEPNLLSDLLVEARHPSIILFLDEVHMLAAPAVRELAESLKPALARGEIACIGATTGEEYQATLESDTALARRFTPVAVEPMDAAGVRAVLVAVRDSLAGVRHVAVSDAALDELIALADQYLPNRSFPDKGVDLVEQSVAYALSRGLDHVDVPTARASVASLIGMPLDPTDALARLSVELRSDDLLDPIAAAALVDRLAVSLRGLDAVRDRPDAVIVLYGAAAAAADQLAERLATILFGRSTARIDIDLSGMTEDSTISTLLGSAPGLVGSERALPLHALRRSPWQVVVLTGIDRCAISIRDTIAAACSSGSFTDAMGRRLPLASAIVILTAPGVNGEVAPTSPVLTTALGSDLVAAANIVTGAQSGVGGDGRGPWVEAELLAPLAVRFARAGRTVSFDPEFVAWLSARLPTRGETPQAYLDRTITPLLVRMLPATNGPLVVRIVDDQPVLEPATRP